MDKAFSYQCLVTAETLHRRFLALALFTSTVFEAPERVVVLVVHAM